MSIRSIAILAMAACASLAHAATTYSVEEVPNTTRVGTCQGRSVGLSPTSGLVLVAACAPKSGRFHYAVWDQQDMRPLRTLYYNTVPGAMNDRGQAAGTVYADDITTRSAVLWRDDGHISELPPLTAGEFTEAYGISATGDVARLELRASDDEWIPVEWHHRTPIALALPAGLVGAYPMAMSPNGTMAGRGHDALYQIQRAVLWSNGSATLVGPDLSVAYAVNDNGQVVGSYQDPVTRADQPFIATESSSTRLPLLPGYSMGMAVAINSLGVAVGATFCSCGLPESAVRWQAGHAQDLNKMLDPASSAAGWVLYSATGIDASGRITAQAMRNGLSAAVLLVPSGS